MKMKTNYEINLRTKAWGLTLEGPDLVITAIHNRFNQFEYRETQIISQFEQVPEAELLEQIDDFLSRNKTRRGDAFLGIPRSEVYTFVVEFPLEAEESLTDTIEYQIEGLYPGDIQEIEVFHQIIGRDDQLKVQVFCIPKTYLGKVFGYIHRWNLKLAGITINHLALVNGLSRIMREDFKTKQMAILHFQSDHMELIGIRDGIISGVYGTQLTTSEEEGQLASIMEDGFSQVRMDPYEVDQFILSGRPAASTLLELQGLGLNFEPTIDTRDREIPAEGLLGVGLAMTGLHERLPFKLNILPAKLQRRHHQLPVMIGLVLLAILAGWFLKNEVSSYLDLKATLNSYQARNEKLTQDVMELTTIRNRFQERQDLVENYKKFIFGENLVLKVMAILTQELPDHSFLTSFSIRDGAKLTMQIQTEDFFEVRNKLEKLPYFANVDTANAISQTRTGNKRKTNLKMDIVLEAFDDKEIQ